MGSSDPTVCTEAVSSGSAVITWTHDKDGTGLVIREPFLSPTGPAVNLMDLVNVPSCGKVETISGTMPPATTRQVTMDLSVKSRETKLDILPARIRNAQL